MNNDQNPAKNPITEFATNVAKMIKNIHVNLLALAVVIIAIVFWCMKLNSGVSEANKLYKAINKALDQDIKVLKKQVKADSLERIAIYKKIDSLQGERLKYDESLQRIDNRLNNIKTGYEKITVRYTDLIIDSLNKLRSRFGQ